MKCDQARDMLLQRLDHDGSVQPTADLDRHLRECPACQEWYRKQQLAAAAVERLTPVRVPRDFSARVVAHLPQRKAGDRPVHGERHSMRNRVRQAWSALLADLGSPVGRRRLAPVLVTAAMTLVVAVGVWAVWQGDRVPVTPGAAVGPGAGLMLAGGVVLVVVAGILLLLVRRK